LQAIDQTLAWYVHAPSSLSQSCTLTLVGFGR
ncbi:MAG: hypothetical protein QOH84_3575, partial [Kribbellaceae bacterium]|nr:hypothetical protein [Kribbellaceae bacterium]